MNDTRKARIHSLGGQFDDVVILKWVSDNNIIVRYRGLKCTAIFNCFAGCIYVDDLYGIIKE